MYAVFLCQGWKKPMVLKIRNFVFCFFLFFMVFVFLLVFLGLSLESQK